MAETNPNSRLEAFCDGVFAIALTLLIIDIKIPSSETINTTNDSWLALKHIVPSIFTFVLSVWVPLTIAIVTTMIWIFWLIYGINIRDE